MFFCLPRGRLLRIKSGDFNAVEPLAVKKAIIVQPGKQVYVFMVEIRRMNLMGFFFSICVQV